MSKPARSSLTVDQIRETLKQVKFPGFSRDIISFGLVKSIALKPTGDVALILQVTTRDASVPRQIQQEVEAQLRRLEGVGEVQVELQASPPPSAPEAGPGVTPGGGPPCITGVEQVIAVASGKGGVGKSTVAVNLACAISQLGRRVGVMDADIYGPSVPKMMGAVGRPTITGERLDPVENFGLKLMSMALLLDPDAPVIWRGPMIMKAIQQFSHAVNWGDLDLLVVDLPPGTGDAQLSLAQTIALDGGVIVTTPQDVALAVARRGIAMLEKVNVPILGLIENMSFYVCPHCGKRDDIFGHDGARREAERLEVPLLGQIPLFTEIRVAGDEGEPVVMAAPDSPASQAFRQCAEAVLKTLRR